MDRSRVPHLLRMSSRRVTSLLIGLTTLSALSSCASPGGVGESTAGGSAVAAESKTGQPVSSDAFAEQLRSVAEMYGIADPPAVEPVREITPVESQKAIDDCLAERGWTRHPKGGFEYPLEQQEAYNMDAYICTASYPIRAEYLEPLDEAAWRRIFDYWITETVPCLRAEGIDVPEPPTIETFLSSQYWTPDGDAVRGQVERLASEGVYPNAEYVFAELCPVSPPAEVRLGSNS
jgi:hypothetical protein